jgi:hypothetical protein
MFNLSCPVHAPTWQGIFFPGSGRLKFQNQFVSINAPLCPLIPLAGFETGHEFPHNGVRRVRLDARRAKRDVGSGFAASYVGDAVGPVSRAADVALKLNFVTVVCDEAPLNRRNHVRAALLQMAAIAHDYAATPSRCLSLSAM